MVSNKGAYFPRKYLTGFFDFLKSNRDVFEVITYSDLAWEEKYDSFGKFENERKNWIAKLRKKEINPKKVYVLIQYDIDSHPIRSMELLSDPSHRNIPANIMIFNKRVNRKLLKETGKLEYTEYEIDENLLKNVEKEGSLIGYHSNAYERGEYSLKNAFNAFDEDIENLMPKYNIKFYTAHGGVPCPKGENNNTLPFPRKWQNKLRWVHNGSSPFFDGVFSDGGHNSLKRDPKKRDIRKFVYDFQPGKRYRLLIHPQYYDINPRISERYKEAKWYAEMIREYEINQLNPWNDFKCKFQN